MYEKSNTHQREVPRLLFENNVSADELCDFSVLFRCLTSRPFQQRMSELEAYVNSQNDPELVKW